MLNINNEYISANNFLLRHIHEHITWCVSDSTGSENVWIPNFKLSLFKDITNKNCKLGRSDMACHPRPLGVWRHLGVLPRGEEAVDPLPVSGQDEETQDADNDQDNGGPDRQQGIVQGRVRAGHELQLGWKRRTLGLIWILREREREKLYSVIGESWHFQISMLMDFWILISLLLLCFTHPQSFIYKYEIHSRLTCYMILIM